MPVKLDIHGVLTSGVVKSVNGLKPDENGNLELSVPSAVTDDHIKTLLSTPRLE